MNYDAWKTSPPDYPEPQTLEYCAQCGRELVEGETVLHDGFDNYLCNDETRECFKKFLIANVDDFADEIVDTMINKVILEADVYEHDEY